MNNNHDERMAKMTFASVYPHYLTKVEKKGRTKDELHQVIAWLTGFDEKKLQALIAEKATFETFFQQATPLAPICNRCPQLSLVYDNATIKPPSLASLAHHSQTF